MRRLSVVLVCALLLVVTARPAQALNCVWNGSTGLWTDTARWSCGVVPDGDDDVTVNGGFVTVSAPATASSLSFTSGQIETAATLTITTAFTWTGGFLSGQGGQALVLGPAIVASVGGGTLHTGGRLQNEGTVTLPAPAILTGSGTFDNRGTLVLEGTQFNVPVDNSGTLRKVGATTTTVGGRVATTGPIEVVGGTLTLNLGTNVLDAQASVAAGATLRLNNATTHESGSSIVGAGTLAVTGGLHIFNGPATWTVASVTYSSGEIRPTGGALTLGGGAFTWTGGFITGQNGHAVVLQPSIAATMVTAGATLHSGGRLQSEGSMTATTSVTGAGVFDNRGTLTLQAANFTIAIENAGTLRKTGAGSTSLGFSMTQSTTGTIDVQAGTLQGATSGTLAGSVSVAAGATLQYRGGTLAAGLTHTGAGTVEFAATVNVLSAYAHPGLTRVSAGQAVFDNAASVTFAALTHTGGFLDIQRPSATITGPFIRTGGTFRATGSTIAFAGAGTQALDLSVATTFVNLAVAAQTTLVEVQAPANATVTGAVTNLGVIRKTRTMAAGAVGFGLTGVAMQVTSLGSLTSVQVDRRDVSHPLADTAQQTGRYWSISPTGAGFLLDLTLPHAVPDHTTASACRLVGSTWDCARASSSPGLVTRTAISTLSDWAVGANVVETHAITGTVRDLNDTGVAGITVNVSGSASRTTTTDADGHYAFTDLPEGGTYVVTPSQTSFAFTPETQTFANLTADQVAAFFIAQTGLFTRYFAEGATSDFFDTGIALLNATGQATTATLRFLKGDGSTVTHQVPLAGLARATVLPKQIAGLENAEFSTVIQASQPVIADRTMRWDASGYGSHAETSIAAPALEWFLAEGATLGGFNLFYLIQNPNTTAANVEVTYLLPAPQPPIVRTYTITPETRFNIWVNLEAPELAAAEVSAVLRSTNGIPVIVERAMYRNTSGRTFDAGHESAGITAAATEWFLAEGATGSYFDLFVLIANPQTTAAAVTVDYLLPGGSVLQRSYNVAAQSRFNIWVDFEDAQLADTAVSARVRSTNAVPIIVERAMWWPGDSSTWHEGHNSAGADRTSTKWGLADGEVGGVSGIETYILIANTSSTGGSAQVTLVFEDGTTAVRTIPIVGNSRESVPVSLVFPEAAGRRFGAVVESVGSPAPAIVVERAMYGNAGGVVWAAGSNVVGTRLR